MNKGTSRDTRKNLALRDDYISVNERSFLDMVKLTLDFSRRLKFYDLQKNEIGNWKPFLLNDSAFVIAQIATSDINPYKKSETDSAEFSEFERIRNSIDQVFDLIDNWSGLLKKSNYQGFLQKELDKLKLYSNEVRNPKQLDESEIDRLREAYENIHGNLVFIKEKAKIKFEEEVMGHHSHHPHIGLLLAFFQLYKNVQNDINSITGKHLDFYFKNLLQQEPRKLKSGSAIIGLKLQAGIEEITVEEGDKFEFLLDSKEQVTFNADSTTTINNAEISEIRTLYKRDYHPFSLNEDDDFSINIVYEADIYHDVMQLENQAIKTFPAAFGEESDFASEPNNKILRSELGFIVSSPALILEKGKQEINLIFEMTQASLAEAEKIFDGLNNNQIESGKLNSSEIKRLRTQTISKFLSKAFLLFITNPDGWKRVEHFKTRMIEGTTKLMFDIHLNEQNEKLVSFDPLIHSGAYESPWPCLKLILNNETQYHPYQFLRALIIDNISIKANVSEVDNISLFNSLGNLDNSIPFTPFGPAPVQGSFLRIQNPKILQRNLESLELQISWNGLPQSENGFADYYRAYPYSLNNSSFKAVITQTRNSISNSAEKNIEPVELFNTHNNTLLNEKKIVVNLKNLDFRNPIIESDKLADENLSSLFIVLNSPEIAFGHQVFTNLYTSAALRSSKFRRNPVELPNLPYTPIIEHLSVNYSNTAKEVMLRKQENLSGCDIQLIQIYPFGHVQVFPGPLKSERFLLPQIEHKGNLFIGLQGIRPTDIVSIGFELIPATFAHTVIKAPKICWEYLINNEWVQLDDRILEDSTNGLLKSGIVKIELPLTIQMDNTRLPKGKFWIRATYDGKERLNSRIIHVFTQAVSLKADDSMFEESLNYKSKVQKISYEGKMGIENISGPFSYTLNEAYENEESFYCRVSEQMRHKNRAVSNWDVERMILERFKNIEKVRVYGRNSHPNELVKGTSMQIVLIPKSNQINGTTIRSNLVDYSTLLDVKNYISQFVSPYLKVEVSNPVYEQIKVRCSVKFKDFQKRVYFKKILNAELINFLSPDIETQEIDKGFDESISKTEILNFIESRPYVDFAARLSLLKIVDVDNKYQIIDTASRKDEELQTISAYAILTSASEHQIEFITDENELDPEISGIGDFSIESDFIISDGKGNYN